MEKSPKIKFYITIIVCALHLSGCGFIPWQFGLATNVLDVGSTLTTGKSTSEHVADGVTQMDCQWSRLFSDWKVCLTHEEYVNNLLLMRCHTYSWNFLNIPYCRNPNE